MEKKTVNKKLIAIIAGAASLVIIGVVLAIVLLGKKEEYRNLKVFDVEGTCYVNRGELVLEAYEDMNLRSGDKVMVPSDGYMRLLLDSDKYVYLSADTIIQLIASGTAKDSKTRIVIEAGSVINEIQNKLSESSTYEITTPNTNMSIRGTITNTNVWLVPDSLSFLSEEAKKEIHSLAANQKMADIAVEAMEKASEIAESGERYSSESDKNDKSLNLSSFSEKIKEKVTSKAEEVKENTNKEIEKKQEEVAAQIAAGIEPDVPLEILEKAVEVAEKIEEEVAKADVKVESYIEQGAVELLVANSTGEDGTLQMVNVPVEAGQQINLEVKNEAIVTTESLAQTVEDETIEKPAVDETKTADEALEEHAQVVNEIVQEKAPELVVNATVQEGPSETIAKNTDAANEKRAEDERKAAEEERRKAEEAGAKVTDTPIPTPTATRTPIPTATNTPRPTNTNTPTPTNTNSPTPTNTNTPTPTNTNTPVPTPTNTPIPTPTNTPVPTPTNTPTPTATNTPVPTATNTPTPTNTNTPTPTNTNTPTPTPTATNTPTPTNIPTPVKYAVTIEADTQGEFGGWSGYSYWTSVEVEEGTYYQYDYEGDSTFNSASTERVLITGETTLQFDRYRRVVITPTPIPTNTNTPTPVPTNTNTPTPTNTNTPTPTNTNTPSPVPTNTNTPTPTATPKLTISSATLNDPQYGLEKGGDLVIVLEGATSKISEELCEFGIAELIDEKYEYTKLDAKFEKTSETTIKVSFDGSIDWEKTYYVNYAGTVKTFLWGELNDNIPVKVEKSTTEVVEGIEMTFIDYYNRNGEIFKSYVYDAEKELVQSELISWTDATRSTVAFARTDGVTVEKFTQELLIFDKYYKVYSKTLINSEEDNSVSETIYKLDEQGRTVLETTKSQFVAIEGTETLIESAETYVYFGEVKKTTNLSIYKYLVNENDQTLTESREEIYKYNEDGQLISQSTEQRVKEDEGYSHNIVKNDFVILGTDKKESLVYREYLSIFEDNDGKELSSFKITESYNYGDENTIYDVCRYENGKIVSHVIAKISENEDIELVSDESFEYEEGYMTATLSYDGFKTVTRYSGNDADENSIVEYWKYKVDSEGNETLQLNSKYTTSSDDGTKDVTRTSYYAYAYSYGYEVIDYQIKDGVITVLSDYSYSMKKFTLEDDGFEGEFPTRAIIYDDQTTFDDENDYKDINNSVNHEKWIGKIDYTYTAEGNGVRVNAINFALKDGINNYFIANKYETWVVIDGEKTDYLSEETVNGSLPDSGHVYPEEHATITKATCDIDGTKTKICVICGKEVEIKIPAGHVYGSDGICCDTDTHTSSINGEECGASKLTYNYNEDHTGVIVTGIDSSLDATGTIVVPAKILLTSDYNEAVLVNPTVGSRGNYYDVVGIAEGAFNVATKVDLSNISLTAKAIDANAFENGYEDDAYIIVANYEDKDIVNDLFLNTCAVVVAYDSDNQRINVASYEVDEEDVNKVTRTVYLDSIKKITLYNENGLVEDWKYAVKEGADDQLILNNKYSYSDDGKVTVTRLAYRYYTGMNVLDNIVYEKKDGEIKVISANSYTIEKYTIAKNGVEGEFVIREWVYDDQTTFDDEKDTVKSVVTLETIDYTYKAEGNGVRVNGVHATLNEGSTYQYTRSKYDTWVLADGDGVWALIYGEKTNYLSEKLVNGSFPNSGHISSGDYTLITKATCDTDGEKSYVCVICGKTINVAIPAGHVYGESGVCCNTDWHTSKVDEKACQASKLTYAYNADKTGVIVTGIDPSCSKTTIVVPKTVFVAEDDGDLVLADATIGEEGRNISVVGVAAGAFGTPVRIDVSKLTITDQFFDIDALQNSTYSDIYSIVISAENTACVDKMRLNGIADVVYVNNNKDTTVGKFSNLYRKVYTSDGYREVTWYSDGNIREDEIVSGVFTFRKYYSYENDTISVTKTDIVSNAETRISDVIKIVYTKNGDEITVNSHIKYGAKQFTREEIGVNSSYTTYKWTYDVSQTVINEEEDTFESGLPVDKITYNYELEEDHARVHLVYEKLEKDTSTYSIYKYGTYVMKNGSPDSSKYEVAVDGVFPDEGHFITGECLEVLKVPTCTEEGNGYFKCLICGSEKVVRPLPMTGHTFVDGECTVCHAEEAHAIYDDEINGYLINSVGEATEIVLPEKCVVNVGTAESPKYAYVEVLGIAANTFSGNGVTKITVPATYSFIAENAFAGANKLTTVNFAKRTRKITISENALGNALVSKANFNVTYKGERAEYERLIGYEWLNLANIDKFVLDLTIAESDEENEYLQVEFKNGEEVQTVSKKLYPNADQGDIESVVVTDGRIDEDRHQYRTTATKCKDVEFYNVVYETNLGYLVDGEEVYLRTKYYLLDKSSDDVMEYNYDEYEFNNEKTVILRHLRVETIVDNDNAYYLYVLDSDNKTTERYYNTVSETTDENGNITTTQASVKQQVSGSHDTIETTTCVEYLDATDSTKSYRRVTTKNSYYVTRASYSYEIKEDGSYVNYLTEEVDETGRITLHKKGVYESLLDASSCLDCGEGIFECLVCGQTYFDDLDPLGHVFYKGKCSRCGALEFTYSLETSEDGETKYLVITGASDALVNSAKTNLISNYTFPARDCTLVDGKRETYDVLVIGEGAFKNEDIFSSFTIPSTIGTIRADAFAMDNTVTPHIEQINIADRTGSTKLTIEEGAFLGVRNTTSDGEEESTKLVYANGDVASQNAVFKDLDADRLLVDNYDGTPVVLCVNEKDGEYQIKSEYEYKKIGTDFVYYHIKSVYPEDSEISTNETLFEISSTGGSTNIFVTTYRDGSVEEMKTSNNIAGYKGMEPLMLSWKITAAEGSGRESKDEVWTYTFDDNGEVSGSTKVDKIANVKYDYYYVDGYKVISHEKDLNTNMETFYENGVASYCYLSEKYPDNEIGRQIDTYYEADGKTFRSRSVYDEADGVYLRESYYEYANGKFVLKSAEYYYNYNDEEEKYEDSYTEYANESGNITSHSDLGESGQIHTVDTKALCDANGTGHYTCKICGQTVSYTIAGGHVYYGANEACVTNDTHEAKYSDGTVCNAKGNFIYSLNEEQTGAVLSSADRSTFANTENAQIVVPKSVMIEGKSYPVVKISINAFYKLNKIVSVELPDTIQIIGNAAFMNATSLTTINLPDGLATIETNAFSYCSSLESVTLPKSLKTLGDFAFANCTKLTSVTFASDDTTIVGTPFNNSGESKLTITCKYGSTAYTFGSENGIKLNIVDAVASDTSELGDLMVTVAEDDKKTVKYLDSSYYYKLKTEKESALVNGEYVLVKLTEYDFSDGSRTEKDYTGNIIATTYDKDDNITLIIYYDENGWVKKKVEYGDENGENKPVKVLIYDSVGAETAYAHSKDADGKVVHDYLTHTLNDDSCAEEICAVCDYKHVYEAGEGHTLDAHTYKDGSYYRECSVCGYYDTTKPLTDAEITKIHVDCKKDNTCITDTKAKCDADGEGHYVCKDCGQTVSYVISGGHVYDENEACVTNDEHEAKYSDGTTCNAKGKFEYSLNSSRTGALLSNAQTSSYAKKEGAEIVIPKSVMIDGTSYPVIVISSSTFYAFSKIKSVVLPNTIKEIRMYAFNQATSLATINLPEGLELIGSDAFGYCSVLESLVLPSTLTRLDDNAFRGCNNMSTITFKSNDTVINGTPFNYIDNKVTINCNYASTAYAHAIEKDIKLNILDAVASDDEALGNVMVVSEDENSKTKYYLASSKNYKLKAKSEWTKVDSEYVLVKTTTYDLSNGSRIEANYSNGSLSLVVQYDKDNNATLTTNYESGKKTIETEAIEGGTETRYYAADGKTLSRVEKIVGVVTTVIIYAEDGKTVTSKVETNSETGEVKTTENTTELNVNSLYNKYKTTYTVRTNTVLTEMHVSERQVYIGNDDTIPTNADYKKIEESYTIVDGEIASSSKDTIEYEYSFEDLELAKIKHTIHDTHGHEILSEEFEVIDATHLRNLVSDSFRGVKCVGTSEPFAFLELVNAQYTDSDYSKDNVLEIYATYAVFNTYDEAGKKVSSRSVSYNYSMSETELAGLVFEPVMEGSFIKVPVNVDLDNTQIVRMVMECEYDSNEKQTKLVQYDNNDNGSMEIALVSIRVNGEDCNVDKDEDGHYYYKHTENAQGVVEKTCVVCGHKEIVSHEYEESDDGKYFHVFSSTDNKITLTCIVCDKKISYTTAEAAETTIHSYGYDHITSGSGDVYLKCLICGWYDTSKPLSDKDKENIHTIDEENDPDTVTKQATCDENGIKTYECKHENQDGTSCGGTVEVIILAGHDYNSDGVCSDTRTHLAKFSDGEVCHATIVLEYGKYTDGTITGAAVNGLAWAGQITENSDTVVVPKKVALDREILNVTRIDSNVFSSEEDLVSVTLPATIVEIGDFAFAYSDSLSSINLGDLTALKSIGESAFESCSSLPSKITIPASVQTVGSKAFKDSAISTVEVKSLNTTIADDAFVGVTQVTVKYYNGSFKAYEKIFEDGALSLATYYRNDNTVEYTIDGSGIRIDYYTDGVTKKSEQKETDSVSEVTYYDTNGKRSKTVTTDADKVVTTVIYDSDGETVLKTEVVSGDTKESITESSGSIDNGLQYETTETTIVSNKVGDAWVNSTKTEKTIIIYVTSDDYHRANMPVSVIEKTYDCTKSEEKPIKTDKVEYSYEYNYVDYFTHVTHSVYDEHEHQLVYEKFDTSGDYQNDTYESYFDHYYLYMLSENKYLVCNGNSTSEIANKYSDMLIDSRISEKQQLKSKAYIESVAMYYRTSAEDETYDRVDIATSVYDEVNEKNNNYSGNYKPFVEDSWLLIPDCEYDYDTEFVTKFAEITVYYSKDDDDKDCIDYYTYTMPGSKYLSLPYNGGDDFVLADDVVVFTEHNSDSIYLTPSKGDTYTEIQYYRMVNGSLVLFAACRGGSTTVYKHTITEDGEVIHDNSEHKYDKATSDAEQDDYGECTVCGWAFTYEEFYNDSFHTFTEHKAGNYDEDHPINDGYYKKCGICGYESSCNDSDHNLTTHIHDEDGNIHLKCADGCGYFDPEALSDEAANKYYGTHYIDEDGEVVEACKCGEYTRKYTGSHSYAEGHTYNAEGQSVRECTVCRYQTLYSAGNGHTLNKYYYTTEDQEKIVITDDLIQNWESGMVMNDSYMMCDTCGYQKESPVLVYEYVDVDDGKTYKIGIANITKVAYKGTVGGDSDKEHCWIYCTKMGTESGTMSTSIHVYCTKTSTKMTFETAIPETFYNGRKNVFDADNNEVPFMS